MIRKLPILARTRIAAPALFCVAATLLATGCATSSTPHGASTSARSGAPNVATLREHHLAAADAAADQYRMCLYGHVARYIDLVPDPARLADEAAAECAPITGRFKRERQAAIVTYTSASDASQQADAATLTLQADGLRVARARATELRALR
ncbi:hypothetical protein PEP31012_02336 [Pandoraea eparura]|jgi:hypothetical protein|uniref:Lipoprotein n=1 Tax=Pandoraea eparura TaxID=2508291 RepID=A0A5E4V0D2_9BURK|nr:hypothetical protein [Pandoraea eparura]VVE05263.1 hypothetical protein PEP31012_02336 [Pandoraea eparura]